MDTNICSMAETNTLTKNKTHWYIYVGNTYVGDLKAITVNVFGPNKT
jgi:hypothetical protein